MAYKEVIYKDIGTVKFHKNKRSKRITVSVRAFEAVRVTLPYRTPYREAENFVMSKRRWIIEALRKAASQPSRLTVFTPETDFTTYSRRLRMIPHDNPKADIGGELTPGEIRIWFPADMQPEHKDIQSFTRNKIKETLRKEAKAFLPSRTGFLADKFDFKYAKVSVREAKTRWGSCSTQNNISLNIHLMRLPEALRDYIILHELCHTVHKNHGACFWNLLDKVCPDSKALNKTLKNYHPIIY